ncbi:MAG: ABC transporter permease [Spirochaetales bacterium]|nr:ABC transporter permease [Spirochaetales bacterium]
MTRGFLIRLAAKNLLRYRRRTVITVTVLAVGIACYILLDSMLAGTRDESELALIYYEMGEGRLVTPEYWRDWKNRPLADSLEDPQGLMRALDEAGVPSAARTEFTATAVVRTGIGGSFPVLVSALDPNEDRRVNRITDTIKTGRFPRPGEDGAAVGEWMAQDMGLAIGDLITLEVTDRWGSREAMELEITGLVNSPNAQINRSFLFVTLDTADDYLSLEGAVSHIQVTLPLGKRERDRKLQEITRIAAAYGTEFHGWRDWSADYLAVAGGDMASSGVILFLVFIIASVGLANTMLMSVMERQREMGMMRSLGMKDGGLFRLFLYEAGLIGLLGSAGGIVLGLMGNIPMVRYGIDFTWMMRDFDMGYRFTGIIHGVWRGESYLYSMISGVLICLSVSWFTLRKQVTRPIVDEIAS